MSPGYSCTTAGATYGGVRGFDYWIYLHGRLVASGWVAGSRQDARREVAQCIQEHAAAA